MKKSISALIDELIITNIKIFVLVKRDKNDQHHKENSKKLQDLNAYRIELHDGLNKSKTIKKSIATLIDELTVTNIKIFYLVDKIKGNQHTRAEAKKAQDLNSYRSELCNELNREFKESETIKV